jgi:hypothetical protein
VNLLAPAAKIEALRRVLRDEAVVPTDRQALTLVRSLPHGHAAAVGGSAKVLNYFSVLDTKQIALAVKGGLAQMSGLGRRSGLRGRR